MRRRRAIALAVIVALLAVALGALYWASRAATVGAFALRMAGDALDLDIRAGGFEYRLRGTPQLVARDVVARQPGADVALLTAGRVSISVPWATLRARGASLDVTRLELDAPALDLAAFQRWWATRPPGEGRTPSFAEGIAAADGRIVAPGWRLDALGLDLPRFAPGAPLRAHVRGRYESGGLRAPFDLRLAMTRASARAGVGLAGTLAPAAGDWRLPARLRLGAALDASQGRIELHRTALSLRARLRGDGSDLPLVAGIAGEIALAGGGVRAEPLALSLRGSGPVPRLRARGLAALHGSLAVALEGELADWPEAWPPLPPPVGASDAPLPFALGYDGPADLGAPVALRLSRDGARIEGRARPGELRAWLDGLDRGTPLPPLDGRLQAPRLELDGATLHGVDIRVVDDAPTP
ncbi:hypothetical protein [Luteimonas huabeiensis]|uniref:hypothetical protein n=1 Tax=Luteimonas huabeiensis TaxID=1244513 RepID=UPI000465BED0|nr:hypothetical protein [Luteimonas huabeiensis]